MFLQSLRELAQDKARLQENVKRLERYAFSVGDRPSLKLFKEVSSSLSVGSGENNLLTKSCVLFPHVSHLQLKWR